MTTSGSLEPTSTSADMLRAVLEAEVRGAPKG
eukprot:CAMPEP_0113549098 /NCGR_PEP_ID=MMETSP0015_2-20120614/13250_1 /TAXON_ID=2838 /ORGANISM="Odontella" /LENGTH=31 /DNA_ID=CAMNT_0000449781 /DNA_START=46 /DNA_END=141 /DNA_ORIENTATION=- /assembly_acc=CAM_ASM_000160